MERSRYLDVLRGIALLGILPVNIVFFALPLTAAQDPAWLTDGALREVVSFHLVRALFEYKFITLFSFLFGAGMMVMRLRAAEGGSSYGSVMVRRLLVLWVFGVLHAVLIWFGDVLSYYAPLGLLLCWAGAWQVRTLKRVGAVLVVLPAIFLAFLAVVLLFVQDVPAMQGVLAAFGNSSADAYVAGSALGTAEDFFRSLQHFGPALEADVYSQGSFLRITVLRVFSWMMGGLMFGFYFGWRIAALFLLGMAAVKAGWFLSPERHRDPFVRMFRFGAAVALPLVPLAAWLSGEELSYAGKVAGELVHYVGSLALAAAYAGGVALLFVSRPRSALWSPIESVGRTAFSNYILQSLVCTTLFYAYGFGLFGTLDRAQLWAVVLAIWTFQLLASPLWLRHFHMGPLEWLWRLLTYARRPQMRLHPPPTPAEPA